MEKNWTDGMYMVSTDSGWDYQYLTQKQIDHYLKINKSFQPPSKNIKPTWEQIQKFCNHGILHKVQKGYSCRNCHLNFPNLILTP